VGIASQVAFSPTAEYLACSSQDHVQDHVQLWRLADNSLVRTFDFGGNRVGAIAFSQSGRDLFAGCRNGHVLRINLAKWEATTVFRETEQKSIPLFVVNQRPITTVFGLAVSPDDLTLAIGLRNGVVLLDLIAGTDRCGLPEEENASDNLVFSRDGKTLVVATGVFATAWDAQTGTKIRVFHGPPGPGTIRGVGISSDDSYFVAGINRGIDRPGTVAIWALRGGDPVVVDGVTSLMAIALLPKTDILVTGSMDGTIGSLGLSPLFRGE
jgi:WD40 repeat protein